MSRLLQQLQAFSLACGKCAQTVSTEGAMAQPS